MRAVFSFPTVVNEKAARSVAAGVMVLTVAALILGSAWIPAVMALGFALRVAAGPRLSPLGRLAATIVAPRLGEPVIVPGPPKRFAQAIGLAFTAATTIAWSLGAHTVGVVLLAVLLVFASLEAVVGFCAGCFVFGHLMRWGIVPEDTCAACADISLRQRQPAAS